MEIFRSLCIEMDESILLVGPRSTLSTESAVQAYASPVLAPSYVSSNSTLDL